MRKLCLNDRNFLTGGVVLGRVVFFCETGLFLKYTICAKAVRAWPVETSSLIAEAALYVLAAPEEVGDVSISMLDTGI